jgi:hypothetical protein
MEVLEIMNTYNHNDEIKRFAFLRHRRTCIQGLRACGKDARGGTFWDIYLGCIF